MTTNHNKDSVPTLEACPFCPTKRRETYSTEGGVVGVIIHDEGCFFAALERRQILTPRGVEKWTSRVSANGVAPTVENESKGDYEAGFLRTIAEGLRHAIRDHGPITGEWIGSASKRVYSRLRGTKYVK